MIIHHILKDGTEVDSVSGYVIQADLFPVLYEIVNRIQMKEGEKKNHEAVSASD